MRSILPQICNESVYRKNAFHILGLPSDASIRTIRRRREDLESAKELGSQTWEREFPYWIGRLRVPTYQQVSDAVVSLEDPRNRMIAELFWIWPIEEQNAAMKEFLLGHRDKALELWGSLARTYGKCQIIALHNLAVVYHALAIEEDLFVIERKIVASNGKLIESYWQKSLVYWKELIDNDDFWSLYERRICELNDPRLTSGFVYRLCQEFAIALCNINAQLALLYIKKKYRSEARRHIGYMNMLSTSDEVIPLLETLLEPQEKHIGYIIQGCQKKVNIDPAQGAACVEEILDASSSIICAVGCFFGKTNTCRLRILSNIFEVCNSFLVAYGNKTKNWYVCAKLNKRLMSLACTPELQKRAEANQQVIEENLELQIEDHICAACGKREGQKRLFGSIVHINNSRIVNMYGEVRRNYESFGMVSYKTIEICVPCCDKCRRLTQAQLLESKQFMRAFKRGYRLGEKPSQSCIRKVWGLPGAKTNLPKQHVGCLVPIALIGFLVVLTGCTFLQDVF